METITDKRREAWPVGNKIDGSAQCWSKTNEVQQSTIVDQFFDVEKKHRDWYK